MPTKNKVLRTRNKETQKFISNNDTSR